MSKEQCSTPLQPCPFCGGEAAPGKLTITRDCDSAGNKGTFTGYFVACIYCSADNQGTAEGWKTPELAAEKWNRRATVVPSETAAPSFDMMAELKKRLAYLKRSNDGMFQRLAPSVEYVEGTAVGYGEDEIDRLRAEVERLTAVPSAVAPMTASDFRLMSESEKYGCYASAMRRIAQSASATLSESPLAWLVFCENDYMVFASESEADTFACGRDMEASDIVPLYRRSTDSRSAK